MIKIEEILKLLLAGLIDCCSNGGRLIGVNFFHLTSHHITSHVGLLLQIKLFSPKFRQNKIFYD